MHDFLEFIGLLAALVAVGYSVITHFTVWVHHGEIEELKDRILDLDIILSRRLVERVQDLEDKVFGEDLGEDEAD